LSPAPALAAAGTPSGPAAGRAGIRIAAATPARRAAADPHIGELAVSDNGAIVNLIDPRYNRFRTFATGLPFADGMSIDRKGNLYVAGDNVVQEFTGVAPQFTGALPKPTTTYSRGLANAVDVTTDDAGDVFVSDNGGRSITEFAPGSNTIVHQCPLGGSGAGTVVDSQGAVFVAFNNGATGFGQIAEYHTGLAGCNATILPPQVEMAGGLQIDRNGDLVIVDENAAVVDIIAPPYAAITSTIGGFVGPFWIALSRDNAEIFVTDPGAQEVFVDSYPAGTPIAVLGTANGLDEAFGVAVAAPGQ
jgi:streptogramin lyase